MTTAASPLHIGPANLQRADVQNLITHHQTLALAANKICEGHSLGLKDYFEETAKGVLVLFEARDEAELLGLCGLYTLSPQIGELKTMHTREIARGRGIGQAVLNHVIQAAREKGMKELYLETGTADYFSAAIRLYARMGFKDCPAFASYVANPESKFMRLSL